MKVLKNLLLFLLVIICIYLSSQVWLQLPDFLSFNNNSAGKSDEALIDIWKVVKPNKYIIKTKQSYKEFFLKNEDELWSSVVNSLEVAITNLIDGQYVLIKGENFPKEYVMLEFENKLPLDIFIGNMNISKNDIKTKLAYIDKIVFGLNESGSIYVYNGDSTVIIKNNIIDNSNIFSYLKTYNIDSFIDYRQNLMIEDEIIPVPVPVISSARNPVFVKSELDIEDKNRIESIAKDYFKNSYDYVRRSEEIEGDILYVYKNEKVLKVSSEGLLDFFDSYIDYDNNSNMYNSLETALRFALDFLEFPHNMYLSSVETVQYDGGFGYKFIFTYRILNKPILFSQVRESAALEVEVIGNNVVSYKRLIRDIDQKQDSEMIDDNTLWSFEDVLADQVGAGIEDESSNKLRVIDKSMIKDISNVYLAYFDIARSTKEQLLRVVWVVDIGDNTYIFNAKTGALIELWRKDSN